MTSRDPLYRLLDSDLLRRLMQRTGSGQRITVRELAMRSGCARGTVGNLLSGVQGCVPGPVAHALSAAIGVDVLVLFAPVGRSVPVPATENAPSAVRAAV
ncbi:XRE family transcriptional regulator [Streptomyces albofaciens JCM 4342]|uniref:XRE family transcriptional regulator n=1 Tax=Streptomyces albofaciens TaxID=66866 RepID=UPI0012385AF3|nr:XRE family transcriptional regulator [Streptomyces albofaciens]KAA6221764.1 XRE family transcriptional regulator [Streptomyces albofaciens JCM 4342]